MRKMRTSILAGVLSASVALAAEAPVYAATQPIWLEINQTYYLNTGAQIERVAVGNPSIADVRILGASAVNVVAFAVGSTALTVWTKDGMRQEFNIVVSASDSGMADMIEKAINMPNVKVKKVGDKILLTGTVLNQYEKQYAESIASMYINDNASVKEEANGTTKTAPRTSIINLLEMSNPSQINLEALVLDVSTSAKKDLGFHYAQASGVSRDSDTGFTTVTFGTEGVFYGGQNFHNFGRTFPRIDVMIQALVTSGKAKILSRPNITTMSGQKADIVVGGSIPYPVKSDNTTSITWKDYGIILHIEPTVDKDNNITSKIETEVSAPDYTNAVTIDGSTYPAMTKRTANAVINVPSGMMMAIGGLMNSQEQKSLTKIPFLGDIPILGELFKYRETVKDKRELMILIRPNIVNETTPVRMSEPAKEYYSQEIQNDNEKVDVDVNAPIPTKEEEAADREKRNEPTGNEEKTKLTKESGSILGKNLNQDVLRDTTELEKRDAKK
ncbi:MAG TPA: type II/III secretion system protein [Selenomonas sp.]|nr:pilus assembly protein N-terminal domain-containing protein [Selenomonadaceae bacterium]HCB93052.1 type II/III secretion system protein [Selenomonas sp.]